MYIYILYINFLLLRNRSCRDAHKRETHVVATWTGYRDVAKARQCTLSSNDSNVMNCVKPETFFFKVTLQGLS